MRQPLIELDQLNVGDIIHFNDPLCNPPKHKFCVIVGMSPDKFYIATVYVNTRILVPNLNSRELIVMHHPIKRQDYPFLSSDQSYIDCSKPKARMQSSFLSAINADSESRIVTSLAQIDTEEIRKLVITSDQITPHEISLYHLDQ